MDVRELVQGHYGSGNLSDAILAALVEAGTDVDHLVPQDLSPVDQLHAGGAPAAGQVLDRLAATRGAQVTGIDLTPEFVDAATHLTARVGLAERAHFVTTPCESMPFDHASFDRALMVHVGMNIPDKQTVFTEVHRGSPCAPTRCTLRDVRADADRRG